MQYKEMLEKTSCLVQGIVKSINEYVNKDKVSYWSVDLEVKGTKSPVNIRLPSNFDRSKLAEYELARFSVCWVDSFDKRSKVMVAIP